MAAVLLRALLSDWNFPGAHPWHGNVAGARDPDRLAAVNVGRRQPDVETRPRPLPGRWRIIYFVFGIVGGHDRGRERPPDAPTSCVILTAAGTSLLGAQAVMPEAQSWRTCTSNLGLPLQEAAGKE
jgi:hypothetical protein